MAGRSSVIARTLYLLSVDPKSLDIIYKFKTHTESVDGSIMMSLIFINLSYDDPDNAPKHLNESTQYLNLANNIFATYSSPPKNLTDLILSANKQITITLAIQGIRATKYISFVELNSNDSDELAEFKKHINTYLQKDADQKSNDDSTEEVITISIPEIAQEEIEDTTEKEIEDIIEEETDFVQLAFLINSQMREEHAYYQQLKLRSAQLINELHFPENNTTPCWIVKDQKNQSR